MTEPDKWLLVNTSDAADLLTDDLTDTLKLHDKECASVVMVRGRRPSEPTPNGSRLISATTSSPAWSWSAPPRNGTADEQGRRRPRAGSRIWSASPAS